MVLSARYRRMRDYLGSLLLGDAPDGPAEEDCACAFEDASPSSATTPDADTPTTSRAARSSSCLTEDRVASDWRLSSVADIPFETPQLLEVSPLRSFSGSGSSLTLDSSDSASVRAHEESARWYIDVGSLWDMGDSEFSWLADIVKDPAEQASIHKYRTRGDRQRALASRLLARRACSVMCGLDNDDVAIARTASGKPFLKTRHAQGLRQPNFNFSISHDDDYVCIVTDPVCLVGVDLVAPFRANAAKCTSLASFEGSFTASEWMTIMSQPTAERRWFYFAIFWSCKEAYVKARGDGLAFDLKSADFSVVSADEDMGRVQLALAISGVPMPRWSFHSSLLPGGYRVTVAKGPPADAVDLTAKLFRRSADSFSRDQWSAIVASPPPDFVDVPMGYLVPETMRDEYQRVFGSDVPDDSFSAFSTGPLLCSRVDSMTSLPADLQVGDPDGMLV